ncbi:hypothetical protein HDV05_005523 [Chytridiales sp. JEL 0842]|nr:hypothetical protein HDV05_005523 [Chytridiales sp. JEL 0842]
MPASIPNGTQGSSGGGPPTRIRLTTRAQAPPPNNNNSNLTPAIETNLDEDDPSENLRGKSGKGYLWEESYKRSWDVLEEDEDGSLSTAVAGLLMQKRRRLLLNKDARPLLRGLIRHLYLIIDLSQSMSDSTTADHLRPNKLESALNVSEGFISEFFEVNPLGSLGVGVMRDGLGERISEMSGNVLEHQSAIRRRENREPRGEASLQNAMELARMSLMHIPSHGSREILIVFGSLSTCDPGDIFETIEKLKAEKIKVSIVSIASEMHICKTICSETGGNYAVVLNDVHFKELMTQNIAPQPLESKTAGTSMIEMGFPINKSFEHPTLCMR